MSDGSLTTLLSSGIDAFSNLWDVVITFPTGIENTLELSTAQGSGSGAYSVRAVGFTPPELTVNTYTVDYKAIQLTRPNAKFDGAREFTIEFRLDAPYALYHDLMKWKHIWFDPSGEGNLQFGALSQVSTTADAVNYGKIAVYGYDSSTSLDAFSDAAPTSAVSVGWQFFDVICTKVGTPTYGRQNSDAATTTASFLFGRMYEPGTSNLGGADNNVPTEDTTVLNYTQI